MNDDHIKQLLDYLCKIYLCSRNLVWIIGILALLCVALRLSKCYGSLWPTPCPVPTEIHAPTSEEMAMERQAEEDRKNEIEQAKERARREEAARQREYQQQLKEKREQEKREEEARLAEAERVYQEKLQELKEKREWEQRQEELRRKYNND